MFKSNVKNVGKLLMSTGKLRDKYMKSRKKLREKCTKRYVKNIGKLLESNIRKYRENI